MVNRTDYPKAFISYSWSSPEHRDFVLSLAENLRVDGVDVKLDQWDLKEGHDKYAFMESMVTDDTISFVIMIVDKKYQQKADGREGGVGTETQIISAELYGKTKQDKFLPVVVEKDGDGEACLPTFLKSRIYIDLSSDETYAVEYEKLLRRIYDKPASVAPPLGKPPQFMEEESPIIISTLSVYEQFKKALEGEKKKAFKLSEDYLNELYDFIESQRISSNNEEAVDDRVISSIKTYTPYRNQFCNYLELVCYYSDEKYYEQIFQFFEKLLHLPYHTGQGSYQEIWFDNFRFMSMELFIYLAAILIRHQKIEALNSFLDEGYYVRTKFQTEVYRFSQFRQYLNSMEYRKQRLKLNRISITADFYHDRASVKDIAFEDFMQADFILCLRSLFDATCEPYWYPISLVYRGRDFGKPFELFARAAFSQKYWLIIQSLLRVETKTELTQKMNEVYEKYNLSSWRLNQFDILPFAGYMNLEELKD